MIVRSLAPLMGGAVLPLLAGAILLLAACGADGDDLQLSPAAAEGRRVANSNGCAACHGVDGQGGVGPGYVGLFGSTVELDDGSTVVADEAYLIESITEPGAKRVAGYRTPMPVNNLDEEQVNAIVAYIRELGTTPSGSEPTGSAP